MATRYLLIGIITTKHRPTLKQLAEARRAGSIHVEEISETCDKAGHTVRHECVRIEIRQEITLPRKPVREEWDRIVAEAQFQLPEGLPYPQAVAVQPIKAGEIRRPK